jgi:Ferritin-like domain
VTALSRKGFIVLAGASAGALAAGCGAGDVEQREREARTAADVGIVRFLLGIEHVATSFWEMVADRGTLRDAGAGELAAAMARNERTHLEVLDRYERRLAGGAAAAPPVPSFAAVFAAGPQEVLRTGARLANVAAGAYLGQANRIQDRTLLASVLAIHSVEGRQAADLNRRAGERDGVFPDDAFAEPLTMAEARALLGRMAA